MKLSPEQVRKCLALAPEHAPQDRVTLPAPPSANHLFASAGRRRVKSYAYRQWLAAAVPALAALRPPAAYPCRYCYVLEGKWNVQRDGANAEKALLDAIVAAGVIPDDNLRYIRGGRWDYEPGGGLPVVTVWFESGDAPVG